MTRRRVPARASAGFWAIALLGLAWNAFGAFDFTMTNIRDARYLAGFPMAVIDYIDEFPVWAIGAWAMGIWFAAAGSVLMLARSRRAVVAFALSLGGLAATTLHRVIVPPPEAIRTPEDTAVNIAIWSAAVFLLCYAIGRRRAGVLR